MTTASRPTWCPAKGTELDSNAAPSLYYSAKDQLAHKKLKTRQLGHNSTEEETERKRHKSDKDTESKLKLLASFSQQIDEDLDACEVVPSDSNHSVDASTDEGFQNGDIDPHEADDNLAPTEQNLQNDLEDTVGNEDEEGEDDTELLLLELEKIKRERMEERKKLEDAEDSVIMSSNPLRFQSQQKSTALVSWTEDTVFKNQATGEYKPKKRFINDMGRSDFHRKFMEKYIK